MSTRRFLRSIMAGAACALVLGGAAVAQTPLFDIPPGELKGALDAYAKQAGVQLNYRPDDVRLTRTAGAHGSLEPEAALQQILANTGLTVRRESSGALAIVSARPDAPAPRTQSAAPVTSASAQPAALEEIVVTAQRRSENLQDVPVAVSSVTAATATRLGINNPQSVAQIVPGFTFNRVGQGAAPFIRGVGSSATFIANEPSVAIFQDDVYIPNGAAAIFEFNNISSVEVLKGPQGTLFGRNATGGVIHVHTREPAFQPTLDATASYANYQTVAGQLYVSGGLSDTVAANLSAFGTHQGKGWGRDVLTGTDVNVSKSWGVQSRLLVEPDDKTSLLLSGSYSRRKSDQGYTLRVVDGFFGRGGYSPAALGAGFWDGAANPSSAYDNKFQLFSAKLKRDMGAATLVSISAYTKIRAGALIDLDISPTNIAAIDTSVGGNTFTQELQLLSPEDATFKWILGAFYLYNDSFFEANFSGAAFPNGNFLHNEQVTNSYSGYAQATAAIMPRTNLTLGLRYTSDERHQKNGFVRQGAIMAGPFEDRATFSSLSGRAALDYRVTPDLMVYVAYNRGFKSGVYNISGFSIASTAPIPPVLPEDLNAYTAGFKSEWLDHRLRLNVEAFYYDYKNIQVQNVVGAGSALVNGGAATIKGLDLELTAAPTSRLTLTANLSLVDGRYDSFRNGPTFFPLPPNAPIAIPPGCAATVLTYPTAPAGTPAAQRACELAGNKTINTPPLSSNVTVSYRIPSDVGQFELTAAWSHMGDYYFEPDNLSFTRQPKIDLFNASMVWTAPSGRYDVRLWANNITKEKYYAYVASSSLSGTTFSPAAPRTYGVTLGAHF